MSIRALRTLVAVSQNGSFRAAAEAENLTPSAVSHQMKGLEDQLGVELFDRSAKSAVLNSQGHLLATRAERMVNDYDNLAMEISPQGQLAGELALGAVPTTLTDIVPKALADLRVLYPALKIRLVPGLTNDLLMQLERGQIQAAVISKPDVLPAKLKFSNIAVEEMMLLTSTLEEALDPIDLLQSRPFIRFSRDAVVGKTIEAWLQEHQIHVSEVMELEGLEAITSMVANGIGVSIVPWNRKAQKIDKRLRWAPLGDKGPRRIVGLASRPSSTTGQLHDVLHSALEQSFQWGGSHDV
ncbi:transcriptional regulator, LysR family [Cognatiyoonia sediminum]|uniref:Transcriptional regulator, LysR family n=1 Tax=Cognatiyoonia sediminum TaxID=1508389 RepID=A0A1M5MMF7_9RHOB|nr:LysR family transcriptional regulator [Cognatiyoonia sediminum]SHG78594.1 transcriptional regulator, LysR family [Cognatiyoonia sediminum]